jgi:hypothetical protein
MNHILFSVVILVIVLYFYKKDIISNYTNLPLKNKNKNNKNNKNNKSKKTDIMEDDLDKCSMVDDWFNKYMDKGKYFNTVEKVNKLFQNDDKQVKRSIKDIYDDLTKTPYSCQSSKCTKKGYTDPFSNKEFHYNDDRTIKNDIWAYDNECPMNGGKLFDSVHGYDASEGANIGI